MAKTLAFAVLVGVAAMTLLAGCESEGEHANSLVPVGISTVRDCLRAAGSYPEDVPAALEGVPKLNALVRSAKRARGAVRTPPPDPTFRGSVIAYFLLFDDPASARRAAARGRQAVVEYRNRFRSSVSSATDYETADVQRNVLTLYLQDPSDAEGQKGGIGNCIRDAPR